MINLLGSYAAELGCKLATTGSKVRLATDCAMEPGFKLYTESQAIYAESQVSYTPAHPPSLIKALTVCFSEVLLISTHICFLQRNKKITVIFECNKCLIWSQQGLDKAV